MTAAFAAVFATLFVGHQIADHWVQTSYQAAHKDRPDWAGRRACAAHVTTYTTTLTALLLVTIAALSIPVTAVGVIVGQLVSAVTHYWADRRAPLAALARRVGRGRFHSLGLPRLGRDDNPSIGTGAYALDQSWHYFWLWVAALLTVTL